ncbi:MAG: dihydropteroate synthase [Alphaproteobacteria bacterium]|nr:dihydropteroate synthase [Alphaproteobacteria bacterium]
MAIFSIPGLGSKPLIMGILNVTPDSFSGDGLMAGKEFVGAALRRAETMIAEGASILDVGGESSRPGSVPVSAEEEIRRTVPIIEAIRKRFPAVPVSVDTVKPEVAAAALAADASMINDISGARQDPAMRKLAAERGAYLVLMHNGSEANAVTQDARLGTMYEAKPSGDVVGDVHNELSDLAERAMNAGVAQNRIILDPGLGFGKTVEQNLRLINELDKLKALGFPVLAGPSRKSFIGRVLDLPVNDRLEGTAVAVAACVLRGANILRVHDVKAMARVAKMTAAIAGSA